MESFYSLSLSLPEQQQQQGMQRNGVTLIECINNYFKSEHITGMKCENCTKNNEIPPASKGFTKKQAIAKLPDCLCIQIQRNSCCRPVIHRFRLALKKMNYLNID